jgi:hypothetical protein
MQGCALVPHLSHQSFAGTGAAGAATGEYNPPHSAFTSQLVVLERSGETDHCLANRKLVCISSTNVHAFSNASMHGARHHRSASLRYAVLVHFAKENTVTDVCPQFQNGCNCKLKIFK